MTGAGNDNAIWELRKGDILIGTLKVYDSEMFWAIAHFVPTPEFEPYRVVFSEGSNLPDDGAEQVEGGKWWEKIHSLGMHLTHVRDRSEYREFILYINGDRADFRV
jgi:hypothetical protein